MSSIRTRFCLGTTLALMLALAGELPARAGGLYANEVGTPEMGTAGAGAEASALASIANADLSPPNPGNSSQ